MCVFSRPHDGHTLSPLPNDAVGGRKVVFRVWENYAADPRDGARFRVELLFSPGADSLLHSGDKDCELSVDTVHLDTAPLQSLTRPDLSCEELEGHLWRMIQCAHAAAVLLSRTACTRNVNHCTTMLARPLPDCQP